MRIVRIEEFRTFTTGQCRHSAVAASYSKTTDLLTGVSSKTTERLTSLLTSSGEQSLTSSCDVIIESRAVSVDAVGRRAEPTSTAPRVTFEVKSPFRKCLSPHTGGAVVEQETRGRRKKKCVSGARPLE